MSKASVMIVEDEVIVAAGLRRDLEAAGFRVAGHAMNGREAVRMARHFQPDVILMDVMLEGMPDGIAAARRIQEIVDTSIIYVSAHSNALLVGEAVRTGAYGYVVKPFQSRQVTSSIEIALQRRREARRLEQGFALLPSHPVAGAAAVPLGHPLEEPEPEAEPQHPHFTAMLRRMRTLLVDEDAWPVDRRGSGAGSAAALHVTSREKEIIRGLICYRRLNKVAEVLGISVHTARNHLKSVFRKLNLHSQDELLRYLLGDDVS